MDLVVCPACHCKDFDFSFRDYGYDKKKYDIVSCKSCKFKFLNPQPTPQELEVIYAQYYGESTVTSKTSQAADHLGFRKSVFLNLIKYLKPCKVEGASLLDVGCGNGDFIYEARKSGWITKGIEISSTAVNFAKTIRNLDVVKGSLETLPFDSETFNVVTILDVLEHVPHPLTTLREINRVLKPGGLLVIRVPNTPFQLVKAKIQKWKRGQNFTTMAAPFHLNHFDESSLRDLVEHSGFEIKTLCPAKADGYGIKLFIKNTYVNLAKLSWRLFKVQLGNILFLAALKK
jgi:2-polyprenyl-3-methyl-5-hydroxy-6-metoxy-1,4-benzoquinol methylase